MMVRGGGSGGIATFGPMLNDFTRPGLARHVQGVRRSCRCHLCGQSQMASGGSPTPLPAFSLILVGAKSR